MRQQLRLTISSFLEAGAFIDGKAALLFFLEPAASLGARAPTISLRSAFDASINASLRSWFPDLLADFFRPQRHARRGPPAIIQFFLEPAAQFSDLLADFFRPQRHARRGPPAIIQFFLEPAAQFSDLLASGLSQFSDLLTRNRQTSIFTKLLISLFLLASNTSNAFIQNKSFLMPIRDLAVVSDQGPLQLKAWVVERSKPVILIPMFSNCQTLCPTLIHEAKVAFEESDVDKNEYEVVVLSFSQEDNLEHLKNYQQRHKLPKSWHYMTSNFIEAKKFFSAFYYPILKTSDGYAHQGQIFFLTHDFFWLGSASSRLTSGDFEEGINFALLYKNNRSLAEKKHGVKNLETWAIWGFLIILLTSAFLLGYATFLSKKNEKS